MADAVPFLEWVTLREYGCVKDATFALTPLHAFVGPNDSGKSTILRGVALAGAGIVGRGAGDVGHWRGQPHTWLGKDGLSGRPTHPGLARRIDTVTRIAWRPDELRQPSALVISDRQIAFTTGGGAGLPGVLDAIAGVSRRSWFAIEEQFLARFETVAELQLVNVSTGQKAVRTKLRSGVVVDADHMSEGQLYWLAFLALRYLPQPPSIALIEEPENGLHPSRIAEVVATLRALVSAGTQVLLATRSPLVLNELTGQEITVVTRTEERGTEGRRLCDTPNYAARSRVYANGELWLSYANGTDEAPLLTGEAP